MPIDRTIAVGADLGETSFSWESTDVLRYHLALGAGADPLSARELRYSYEKDLRVLPSFAVVAPTLNVTAPPRVSYPGIEIDLAKVVHGSQSVTVHHPIPTAGKATAHSRIVDVFDKGKAAVIVQQTDVRNPDGIPLWTARSRVFAKDEGGFGGDRGPSDRLPLPDRDPDHVIDTPTLPQQALLYRLCGDRNPLHVDPEFATTAGYPAPILHGLCTYGMVAKAVTDVVLDGDPHRIDSWSSRFAGVVYPGETLRIKVWAEAGRYLVTTESIERNTPVLADAVLTTN